MNTESYGDALDCALKEIARLHEVNQELLGALTRIVPIECQMVGHRKSEYHGFDEPCPVVAKINTAIAKAGGSNET